ncbi:MAG: acyltransferase family protein [Eubacteriales bacterium]|nr:acyltransferase family protein [Eubacteriales bacterium]
MTDQRSVSRHNYSLDSLRFMAVLGVFFYHLNATVFPYAYLGVVGFFGLAGYLSMRKLILAERHPAPRPGLGQRLADKIEKLFPPLIFFLLIISILMLTTFPAFLDNYAGQLRSTALASNNIWQIVRGESYFEGQGYFKPLVHMWALSLEMQFYLVFSLLVESTYKQRDRSAWTWLFGLLSLASYLLLLYLYDGSADPSRVYYGTDTRFFSFSLGALAALVAEPGHARSEIVRMGKDLLLALCSLALVAAFFLPVAPDAMIRYGLLAYSLLLALTMGLAADDQSFLTNFGKNKVVQYICSRSYFIYLWHFPCFRLAERLSFGRYLPVALYYVIVIAAALLLAELAYRIDSGFRGKRRKIQTRHQVVSVLVIACMVAALCLIPWQAIYESKGGSDFRKLEQDLAAAEASLAAKREARRQNLTAPTPSAAPDLPSEPERPSSALTWGEEVFGSTTASEDSATESETDTIASGSAVPLVPNDNSQHDTLDTGVENQSQINKKPNNFQNWLHGLSSAFAGLGSTARESEKDSGSDIDPDKLVGSLHLPVAEAPSQDDWLFQDSLPYIELFNQSEPELYLDLENYYRYRDIPISLIGDSVSVINSYHIFGYLPNLELDAMSNRQMREVWDIYTVLKEDDLIGEVLIVALGSNGDIDTDTLTKVWEDLGDKPLLLVNIVLPYSITEAERNTALETFVQEHEGVYLIDWRSAATGHPDYFQEDLIHPNDYGCKAYSQLLTKSIVDLAAAYERAGLLDFYPDN